MRLSFYISICLIFYNLLPNTLSSQIDIKTGYVSSIYNYDGMDALVNEFNNSTEDRLDDLNTLNLTHGIDIGMRYKFGFTGFILGYQISLDGSKVEYTNNIQPETKLRYRHHGIYTGLESYFGPLGIGTAFQYNILKIRGETGSNGYSTLISENYFTAKIYLILTGRNIALQPFIDIPFGKSHSLDGVSDFLGISSVGDQKIPLVIGVKLLIYNGSSN